MFNIFKNHHPASWVPSVYFAMGLPFVAIAAASSLMFKNLGVSDAKIAFWTTLIMIPWTLKPLWSPLLEMFKTKKTLRSGNADAYRNNICFGCIFIAITSFF